MLSTKKLLQILSFAAKFHRYFIFWLSHVCLYTLLRQKIKVTRTFLQKRICGSFSALLVLFYFFSSSAFAKTKEYSLTIEHQEITFAGIKSKKVTVNNSIPAPILEFVEGDEAIIHVTNKMNEDSSIHWHGLLVPGFMDGVPGLNSFTGIKPGETFTYHFKIRQNGTYWYHAHSMAQEQDGLYGAIVIKPKRSEIHKTDRDYVILLSDFHQENGEQILANLKKSSEYYQYQRQTIGDFFADVKKYGFKEAWKNKKMWNEMRMLPTDLADVAGYKFLVNGKDETENWTGLFKAGEKIRLRFINASSMSFYDVQIPGLKMKIVAADGQNIEPIKVDEFRFGPAETYDVIVTPPKNKAYAITAESLDRSGFALATLAPRVGMKAKKPQARKASLLTMADMPMDMKDMDKMDHSHMSMNSGWSETNSDPKARIFSYSDLKFLGIKKDLTKPVEEIFIKLGGNMERYIWTLNGKKYSETKPIKLKYGQKVRLIFINETMMAHPMHLHGMFVELENGQPLNKLPNKHTVIVPPNQQISVLLTANEEGEWALHCHLLYHMLSGMMTSINVSKNAKN